VYFTGGIGAAVFVELEVGFQAFLGGTIICMVIGQLIVLLHHRAAGPEHSKAEEAPWMDKLALKFPGALLDDYNQNLKLRAGIYAFALAAIGLGLLVSSFMNLSVLEVEGLFGWFLNYLHGFNQKTGQPEVGTGNVFTLSVASLGYSLGAETPAHTKLWAVELQACYFAFTVVFVMIFIVVGIGQCLFILMMDEFNAHKETLVLLKFVGSTLFAWAAIDVFVIGAIVTIFEMESGSFTFTHPFFTKLIHNLREANMDIPGEGDVIMTLRPKLCAGAYLTTLSSVAFIVIGVQFIRFLGRLQVQPQQEAAVLEGGSQMEAESPLIETAA